MEPSCESTEELITLIRLCNTAHQLDKHVLSLETLAEQQVQTTSSIVSGLVKQVLSIKRSLENQHVGSEKLMQNSEKIIDWLKKEQAISVFFKNTSDDIKKVWSEISEFSPLIIKMLESIYSVNNIFDLLHILSINTAIEASKFNEKGRAFAIIAKEMRKLADQSRQLITAVQEQTTFIDSRLQKLLSDLSHAIKSQQALEQTINSFFSDSVLIQDNTKTVHELVTNYSTLSEAQILEWEQSIERIKGLEEMADKVFEGSRQIQTMADELFSMIKSNASSVSQSASLFYEDVMHEIRELAAVITVEQIYEPQKIDAILMEWSAEHELFELLYVLDAWGIQSSSNIYALRYRSLHSIHEGLRVDRSDREYYLVPKRLGEPFLSNVYLSSATKALCITAAIPLYNLDSFCGVLCADIDLQYLSSRSC